MTFPAHASGKGVVALAFASARRSSDAQGAAYAGSQLQTRIYVNAHQGELNGALVSEFPELAGQDINWRSPLAEERYREYRDREFLDRVGLVHHASALEAFWPRGGPVWDAIAGVELEGGPGVVLAEGKSYPQEIFGAGCEAVPESREKIDAALARTQEWLGLAPDPERWCGRLYQTANRLAHLYFFNEVLGVRAWLVHLLFVDDPHSMTSAREWGDAVAEANRELGLERAVPRAGHVVLPARSREELHQVP